MTNYEIAATNYPSPDIITGQHTNGPPIVFVKVDGQWVSTKSKSVRNVCLELERNGPDRIVAGTWSGYEKPHHYGYCPQCDAPGKIRERRPYGDDICANGHRYKSSEARSNNGK